MAYRSGQKLGNYQLERLLGHGGFAEVYLGKHIYLNTQAAIKVLQRQFNDEGLENFLQEARIIAGLKHPHIVRVLEFGVEEQRPFLVMAYAPHGTLRRRYSRDKTLSPPVVAPYVRQIADALQYAHERKIIHRDVKPENMLLDDDNAVLLSDFGLAVRERSTYRSVHSTDSAGTTIYMSPEQLRGKPCAASDQYALGVVIYEWLCGCLPFDGPDISVVVQHLHESPVPLREHVPALSEEVEAVVLRALEKDPKQRFASVQELALAFEEACKDIPVVEDADATFPMDTAKYEDSEYGAWQQESLSGGSFELQPDSVQRELPQEDGAMPVLSWPSPNSSLHVPSLSTSLDLSMSDTANVSTSARDVLADVNTSTPPSQNRAHISRRTMIAGLVGIGAIVGGIGIWRLSSNGIGTLPQNVQAMRGSVGTTASPSNRRISGTGGSASSGADNGAGKNGAPNPPVAAGKNGVGGPSTPSTSSSSSSGSPAATSTPASSGGSSGATPGATNASGGPAGLTVQISVPSSIAPDSNVPISVTTNLGNVPFDVIAEFYYTDKNGQTQNTRHANINGNTTDTNGNATINWQSWHIPPGQLKKMTNPRAVFQAIATDNNGNSVSSQTATAQVE
ncbi:MAG: serine/threonine protein kinase [Ktedonobacteraceae bacterium]|nr:serine/threonine protein kinase [Ktedonobacteraceae bacterium]